MDGFNEWFNNTCERLEKNNKRSEIETYAMFIATAIKEHIIKQGFSNEEVIEILKDTVDRIENGE